MVKIGLSRKNSRPALLARVGRIARSGFLTPEWLGLLKMGFGKIDFRSPILDFLGAGIAVPKSEPRNYNN